MTQILQNPTPKIKINKLALFKAFGYVPHAGQERIHNSTAQFRLAACGTRFGKSKAAAGEGLAAMYSPDPRGSVGWVCAPTYALADKVFREIKAVAVDNIQFRKYLIEYKQSPEEYIKVRNFAGAESVCVKKSGDAEKSLVGEGLNWLVLDEASRVKPTVWQEHLLQRLIDKPGWAFIISTPKRKGWFADWWKKGQGADRDPHYESWNASTYDNPYLTKENIDIICQGMTERQIAQEIYAEFVSGDGQVFNRYDECATGTFEDPQAGESYYAGLDLAKTEDYTVLTIINRNGKVVFVDRFRRLDWEVVVSRVHGHLSRYNDPPCYVDSTGKGEPVFELLKKSGIRAIAYPFTGQSRMALIANLSIMVESQKITIPRREVFSYMYDEMENFEYVVSPTTGEAYPEASPGYHDDCVMSLGLASWSLRKRKAPLVMVY